MADALLASLRQLREQAELVRRLAEQHLRRPRQYNLADFHKPHRTLQ